MALGLELRLGFGLGLGLECELGFGIGVGVREAGARVSVRVGVRVDVCRHGRGAPRFFQRSTLGLEAPRLTQHSTVTSITHVTPTNNPVG